MISAALWSTLDSFDGSASSGLDRSRAGSPGVEHLDVGPGPPLVPVEVVAGRADELGRPRQVLADVVVVDRRMEAEAFEQQPAQRRKRRIEPPAGAA